jgi:hypothetical protein
MAMNAIHVVAITTAAILKWDVFFNTLLKMDKKEKPSKPHFVKLTPATVDTFIATWNKFVVKAHRAECLRDLEPELYHVSDNIGIMVTEMNKLNVKS